MPSTIDPPVGPYSQREDILAWIEDLKRMPPAADVLQAIEQAETWLEWQSR